MRKIHIAIIVEKIKFMTAPLILMIFVSNCIVYGSSPTQVGNEPWNYIDNTHGIRTDGTLWQLGKSPVQIGHYNDWIMVASSNFHSLGIRSDGTLWAWGDNSSGQLGINSKISKDYPVPVGLDTNWTIVSAGRNFLEVGNHSVGIRSDGTLWGWGDNSSGQLGDGTTTGKMLPAQIGSDTNWAFVAAGGKFNLGIRSDGTLWAWGDNTTGQLGDGTTTNQLSPIQIGTEKNWLNVAAGSGNSLGLRTDGTLWAWGSNVSGEIGDGTYDNKLFPVQIGLSSTWTSITTGYSVCLAIRADGTLWAWGRNEFNGLNNGNPGSPQSLPVQVGLDVNWKMVTVTVNGAYGIRSDGTLWAWGY